MNRINYFKKVVLGKSVLDLGCMGDVNNRLSISLSRYCDYLGVDKCQERLIAHPNAIYGDIQDLPNLGKFDIILCLEVIEHIENLNGLFKGINRNLKSGGKVYFTFDNPWAINRVLRGWFFKETGYMQECM